MLNSEKKAYNYLTEMEKCYIEYEDKLSFPIEDWEKIQDVKNLLDQPANELNYFNNLVSDIKFLNIEAITKFRILLSYGVLTVYNCIVPSKYSFMESLLLSMAFESFSYRPYTTYIGIFELLANHNLLEAIINENPYDLDEQKYCIDKLIKKCINSTINLPNDFSCSDVVDIESIVKTYENKIRKHDKYRM